MRNYEFPKLTAADLPLLERWFRLAHVRVWWPDTVKQLTMMEKDLDNPQIDMRLVILNGHPFAYLHDHDARAFTMPQYGDLPAGARVMATFVGDSDFIGQDHPLAYITARLRQLRLKYPLVAVGPNTNDTRAIAIYTKAGFHKRRLAPTKDGKLVQVMTHL